ncbi:SMC5-SMC6 complex localization factor protein 1-like [Branchiostoma floridae]|uniref:SMC5-SMC6 complex localization factor protein 1-like n=1 Tax=Branchiostoma floridae TaxID=7739 RepID=A0A9J7LWS7_BRAFL|nr:SMC5-SMC6 complex localization factor protein 1-like [Branchiostoma floridae]
MAVNCRQRYVFQLSGFSGKERDDLTSKIQKLKGVCLQEQPYKPSCTHIISSKPCRSEKYLAACAAGKWIVTRKFLDDSSAAGRWLDESPYEYGHKATLHKAYPVTLLQAPRRWRQRVAQETVGAFAGWRSIVVVDDQKRRAAYKRLLEAGGATVLKAKTVAHSQAVYAPQLTHVFLEKKYDSAFRILRRRGVLCLSPDYIAEFLLRNPPAEPAKFDVAVYVASSSPSPQVSASVVGSQIPSVATGDKSSSQVTREASSGKVTSRDTEISRELKSVSPNRKQASPTKTNNRSSASKPTTPKKSSPIVEIMGKVSLTPKKVRMESSTPEVKKRSISTLEKEKKVSFSTPVKKTKRPFSTPEKKTRSFSTSEKRKEGSFPLPEKVTKESIPTKMKTRSFPSPVKVKKESVPSPVTRGFFPTQGKVAHPTQGKVQIIPSSIQLQLEGMKKRPLLTDSGKDRDMLQLMASKRRKLDVPGACFQPCFPVNNSKSRVTKVSQRSPLPLAPAVCTSVEVALDDHAYPTALSLLQSSLSTIRYPPTHLLHRVMAEALLHAEDSLGAAQAYQVLKQVQTLHPPSRTPVNSYMYLKALRTPVQEQVEKGKGRKGRKQQQPEKQKEGVEWDFVKMVIRGAIGVTDTQTTEEPSGGPLYQSNCALLLKFLVSILEQDFMAWMDRDTQKAGTPSCVLASLLWPSGHCGVMTSHVIDLVSLLFHSLQTQGNQQVGIVCLVQSIVAMAAECCQAADRQSDRMTSLTGSFRMGTSVCNLAQELVVAYQKDPANQTKTVLHRLLETLQPPWLKLKVAQSLLGCYDDSLVAKEQHGFHKKPLSLRRVLLCYMYLVPKSLVSKQTAPASKGKEKVPQENPASPAKVKVEQGRLLRRGSSRGEPLRTLVDANHVKQLPVVAGKRKGSSTPEASPKKKPKLQVNRRNVRGETQLHVACIKNNVSRVRDLLSVPGIDVNAEDYAGWTPLHEACNHGHVEVVRELLAFKPQPSVASFFTVKNKDSPVKMSSALDLLAAPPDGTTALHDAVANGHVAVVTMLLEAGGKILLTRRNATGQTPFDLAVSEEMKAALQTPANPRRKPQVPTNKILKYATTPAAPKDAPIVPNRKELGQYICQADYDRVLGRGTKQETTNEDCEKFATIVSHFTRAYVRVEQLQPMKKQRERQLECGSNSSGSSVCSYSNGRFTGANTSPISPISPVVVLKDIMQKAKSTEVKEVEKDLTSYMDIDKYLQGYERHLKMLTGQKETTDFCRRRLMEIRSCS